MLSLNLTDQLSSTGRWHVQSATFETGLLNRNPYSVIKFVHNELQHSANSISIIKQNLALYNGGGGEGSPGEQCKS